MNIQSSPQPFILKFKVATVPQGEVNPFMEQGAHFDEERMIWLQYDGSPLWANRASRPYTSCSTPGHMIKGGYTPKGSYKPARYVPSKTDKRSGK